MIAPAAALWFLPVSVLIGLWVAWSDMKFMKIPNKAVLAMAAAYALLGWPAFGLTGFLWGWAVLAMVLAAGFVANAAGLVGAGDAKFAAAMAPVFSTGDARLICALFAACLLGAFATHRLTRALPATRRIGAGWESWQRQDFPMGLALAGTLIFYLLAPFLAK